MALIAVVRKIVGSDADVLRPLSMEGLTGEQVYETALAVVGSAPAILFTDLPGGTCTMMAPRVAHARTGIGIVSGVNLPMLLDFVLNRALPLEKLTIRVVERGRRGIIGECM